jgi:hypothetical protein
MNQHHNSNYSVFILLIFVISLQTIYVIWNCRYCPETNILTCLKRNNCIVVIDTSLNCRRVWKYQRSNPNPYIEETDNTMATKKGQRDKQRSTKKTYKIKDRVTQTPLKIGGELRCSGRLSNSSSTSGNHRFNLVTNIVISHEWGKDRELYYYK